MLQVRGTTNLPPEKLEQQDEVSEEKSEGEQNSIGDYTLAELLAMKKDVEEIQGEGVFQKFVGQEIMNFLGMSKTTKMDVEKENMKKQTVITPPRNPLQRF